MFAVCIQGIDKPLAANLQIMTFQNIPLIMVATGTCRKNGRYGDKTDQGDEKRCSLLPRQGQAPVIYEWRTEAIAAELSNPGGDRWMH